MRKLICILIFLPYFTFGQVSNDSIKVIAKLISSGQGSKIYIAKFEILKTIKGEVSNDLIHVGYHFYTEYKSMPDTALLTLVTYNGKTKINDYYIFPEYDAKKGIENVKLSYVQFDYWESCETGQGECKPLNFTRPNINEKWFLIMPCGGTFTTVTLSQVQGIPKENVVIQKEEISHSQCPPAFELTNLTDGKYFAYMLACGLGGQIEINLNTE